MKQFTISEMPSSNWELQPTFNLKIDRTGTTVAEYLEENKIVWQFGRKSCDIRLYKETPDQIAIGPIVRKVPGKILRRSSPHISLIGEPRELAPLSYRLADPKNTLAAAPGSKFERLFYACEWTDPLLDGWNKRLDRFCMIGRPTPERIELAKKMASLGIELDIYSRRPWPLPNWKGYAESEIETARRYKYKIVSENSSEYRYHSEKLFNSIRSGCVTFYSGDANLDLSFLGDSFFILSDQNLASYRELSSAVVKEMEKFMFSEAWEIYSFKQFYGRIIDLSLRVLGQSLGRNKTLDQGRLAPGNEHPVAS